jgi:transposase-like protein
LTKQLVERAMEVELTDHLGYEPHQLDQSTSVGLVGEVACLT